MASRKESWADVHFQDGHTRLRRELSLNIEQTLSINKSQGQTLDCVGLGFRDDSLLTSGCILHYGMFSHELY